MREYSREEINRLWTHAYYGVIGGGELLRTILFFLAFLLFPIAVLDFNRSLLVVWVLFSIFLIVFALHVRSIVYKSKKGDYPARVTIIRSHVIALLGGFVLWFSFFLLQFGLIYLVNPNNDLTLPAILTIIVYIVTVPLAFVWANGETYNIATKREGIMRSGNLNMFGGWMQKYYWVAVILHVVVWNLFASLDLGIRIISFLFPYAGLMLFILIMRNVNFLWTLLQLGPDASPFQGTLKEARKQVKEMAKHSGRTRTPVWCEGCNAQGEIEVDDPEGNYFVICEVCGAETAEVWCDDGVGGQFVHNIHEHPYEYDCEICRKTHQLPADFYEKPVTLKLIEEPRNKRKK